MPAGEVFEARSEENGASTGFRILSMMELLIDGMVCRTSLLTAVLIARASCTKAERPLRVLSRVARFASYLVRADNYLLGR